jgi:hypothetical protein
MWKTLPARIQLAPLEPPEAVAKIRFSIFSVRIRYRNSLTTKKPRAKSEARRHTLSREECQLRPVWVRFLTLGLFASGTIGFHFAKTLDAAVPNRSEHPSRFPRAGTSGNFPCSAGRSQWRDRGRFSRPSISPQASSVVTASVSAPAMQCQ